MNIKTKNKNYLFHDYFILFYKEENHIFIFFLKKCKKLLILGRTDRKSLTDNKNSLVKALLLFPFLKSHGLVASKNAKIEKTSPGIAKNEEKFFKKGTTTKSRRGYFIKFVFFLLK